MHVITTMMRLLFVFMFIVSVTAGICERNECKCSTVDGITTCDIGPLEYVPSVPQYLKDYIKEACSDRTPPLVHKSVNYHYMFFRETVDEYQGQGWSYVDDRDDPNHHDRRIATFTRDPRL